MFLTPILLLLSCAADKDGVLDSPVGDTACEAPVPWYPDTDGDGFGNDAAPVVACQQPSGTVAVGGDCDDADPEANPSAQEQPCNGLDDDCDGPVDEEPLSLAGGTAWLSSSTYEEHWNEVGFDASAWGAVVTPALDDCGWTFTPENLNRDYQSWEHAGTPTMWSPDGLPHVYFRFVFYVSANATVSQAMLTSIVDDEHTVYLNGVEVGADPDPEAIPIVETDLSKAWVVGENVLAVDAENLGGCAWALLDGLVSCAQ